MFRPDCSIRFVFLGLVLFSTPAAAGVLPTVTLTVPDGMAAEAGQDTATFTITRTAEAGTGSLLRVYLELSGTAARPADYTTTNLSSVSGSTYYVQIPVAQTSISVTVTPARDNLNEGEETVGLAVLPPQLKGHDYLTGDPSSGQATISDDVAEVHLTVDDSEAAEAGQDPAVFTVTRNGQGNTAALLRVYLQLGGTAARPADYTTTNLSFESGAYFVQIPVGQTSISVTMTPARDNLMEGEENITLEILPPQLADNYYTIGDPSSGQATISDDVAEVHLTVNDSEAAEAGQDPAVFTVTRNGQGNTAALLRVYLQLGGTAARPADYTTTNLSFESGAYFVQIPVGQTSISVTMTPTRDNLMEGEENITLEILPPQLADNYYTVGEPDAGGATISDEVATVTITAADDQAAELGQETATFTITRSNQANTGALLRVYLQLGGTAARPADYTTTNLSFVSGSTYYVQIPVGALNHSVVVTPVLDQAVEGDETVSLTVLAPQLEGHDYLVGMPSQAVVTILDSTSAIMDDGFETFAK